MAVTSQLHSGNAILVDFALTSFPYTAASFVEVYVDAVLQTQTTDYSFLTPTSIRFVVAPPATAPDNIEFRRNTSTTPLIDWTTGASILEENLDTSDQQMLHAIEELENTNVASMNKLGLNWDADGLRIVNGLDPVDDQDFATKASIAAQVTAAELAESNAQTSEFNVIVLESQAQTAKDNAETAETGAEAAEAAITAVIPVSGIVADQLYAGATATTMTLRTARYDQFISETSLAGATTVEVALTGGWDAYRIVLKGLDPATNLADLDMRMSDDNDVSYYATADYNYSSYQQVHVAVGTSVAAGNEIQLVQDCYTADNAQCDIELTPGNGAQSCAIRWSASSVNGTNVRSADHRGSGRILAGSSFARMTHVQFLWSTGNFSISPQSVMLYGIVGY